MNAMNARTPPLVGALVLVGGLLGSVFGTTSCSATPDPTRVTVVNAPVFRPDFSGDTRVGVSSFLEKRCGTLDCHGQLGRPLRIFGKTGLRLVLADGGGNFPGGSGTTDDERYANYQAAVTLEPELMTQVENNAGVGFDKLLLVRKPRQAERHKGGQIIVPGDDGDTCLVSWIQGATDFDACDKATQIGNQ